MSTIVVAILNTSIINLIPSSYTNTIYGLTVSITGLVEMHVINKHLQNLSNMYTFETLSSLYTRHN